MKKTMVILMATALFAAAVPVMAETTHGTMHAQMDEQCAKECELLLKDCNQEVDSIQQRIQKIKSAIETNGAKPEHRADLIILNKKLKEANQTLRDLSKPGR